MTASQQDTAELEQTIRARLQTLTSLAATIAKNPRGTLLPSSDSPPHSGKTALEALRKIKRDPAALRVHETLGQGGMGIVHVGHQVTLDRRVAVKTLRDEHLNGENIESLLGEAWLAGSLEHPNVVPIYDLGLDESGAPLLVMKRIEGDTWSDLLCDPATMKKHALDVEPLEFNLRVLIQVCNAIHFAHSRSVIHRDLKPDNVMVGHFGEVYVLDWGVAMRPGPAHHVAGTLVYMAPELLGGAEISARTDVYLLGAVLYEILTGKAPHDGPNMQAMVSSVVLSSPALPSDVPEELGDLVRACMARDPAERPESALAVRRAVELFLEHRGAITLAAQAEQKLEELERILRVESPEIERAYNVFGECRFGFRQALRAWPEADIAKAGLRRAVSAMVRFEAEKGDARAAALLVTELDEKDPELEALVETARKRAEEEAKRIAKLEELEKDNDPRQGRSMRWVAGMGFAAFWTIAPAIAPWTLAHYPNDEGLLTIPLSLVCLVFIAVSHRVWRVSSRINRQLIHAFTFGVALQPLMMLSLKYALHADPRGTIAALMAYWCVVLGAMAAAVDRRLGPVAGSYGLAFLGSVMWPDHRYLIATLANVATAIIVAVIWSRRGTELAIEYDKRRRERGTICE